MDACSIHTNLQLFISTTSCAYLSQFCLTEPFFLFRFKVVSALAEIQRQRGKKKTDSGKEKAKEILTGICYSHRHHAASEREGALLV